MPALSYPLIFLDVKMQPMIAIGGYRVAHSESCNESSGLPLRAAAGALHAMRVICGLRFVTGQGKMPQNPATLEMRGFLSSAT